ncbi:hypothetical protein [Nocardiopsis sp. YSL2]|uniref:hypothetical protein n=1 Tax=Nocardiopsis sp. YSL2 TaxID=2939492 RepID=UPI0026F4556D|nr:hypothetical protein [Nocardiopsis sp. YSL2]
MNTADPNRYLDDFLVQVQDGLKHYSQVDSALEESNTPANLRKAVAEDSAFRLGALWEVFQGRWHVAAISRDPENFLKRMNKELEDKIKDSLRNTILAFNPDALTMPRRPKLAQIEFALDPTGFNITFKDTEAWIKSSVRYHSSTYQSLVRRISADAESASFLNLLKKMRNHLAHGSYGSKAYLNRACKQRPEGEKEGLVGAKNEPLKRDQRDVRDVGAYLRARTGQSGERRIEIIHQRTIEVAQLLRHQ